MTFSQDQEQKFAITDIRDNSRINICELAQAQRASVAFKSVSNIKDSLPQLKGINPVRFSHF